MSPLPGRPGRWRQHGFGGPSAKPSCGPPSRHDGGIRGKPMCVGGAHLDWHARLYWEWRSFARGGAWRGVCVCGSSDPTPTLRSRRRRPSITPQTVKRSSSGAGVATSDSVSGVAICGVTRVYVAGSTLGGLHCRVTLGPPRSRHRGGCRDEPPPHPFGLRRCRPGVTPQTVKRSSSGAGVATSLATRPDSDRCAGKVNAAPARSRTPRDAAQGPRAPPTG